MAPASAQGGGSPIDVLIPAIEKDLPNLPFAIDSLRKMVRHPIGRIYVVSPRSRSIEQLCRTKGCTFVDENTVLPLTVKDIRYRSSRWNRSGWMFQQLLKLSGDAVVSSRRFLVTDADTVLIRPHMFRSGDKTVFYSREWSQPEYFRAHRRLLGQRARAPRSFVAHYMLLDKVWLKRLKAAIEAKHRMPWYEAILKHIDTSRMYAFSEFETYGNFLYSRSPGKVIFRPTKNKPLQTNISRLSAGRIKRLSRQYRSLSFHKRKGYYLNP